MIVGAEVLLACRGVGARQQRFKSFLVSVAQRQSILPARTTPVEKHRRFTKARTLPSKRKTFPVSQPEIDWNSSLRRGRAANRGVGKITLHEYFTAFLRNLYEFWDGMGWNRLERRL